MVKINVPMCLAIWGVLFSLNIAPGFARTSLVALPQRTETAVKLNQGRLTLVQEKRLLSLDKGLNKIDFSWQNVMIEPDSIQLTPLSNQANFTILSVSFPPNESALVWHVYCKKNLQTQVMISYLLSGIDGLTTYTAVADTQEKQARLKTFMVIRNFSGEDFNRALFSNNGSDNIATSVRHLETKRIQVSQNGPVPIQKMLIWDALQMPHDPELAHEAVGIPVSYRIDNSDASKLGSVELFKGKARLFQTDRSQTRLFLGEDRASHTPIGDTLGLKIGESRDVIVTRRVMEKKRNHIQRDKKGNIQVFDEDVKLNFLIKNTKDKPVVLTLVETIPGHWKPVDFPMEYQRKDHKTISFEINLSPKEKRTLQLGYRILNQFTGSFARFNTLR